MRYMSKFVKADLAGQIAIVTGATSGIGKEAAYGLANLGARVVICGRTRAKIDGVIAELAARGVPAERFEAGLADLARVPAARELAASLAQRFPRLDILLNNAGCYPAAHAITPDGHEEAWATNVLAYEALTTGLLPSLRAARGRIVYVASTRAGNLDLDDLDFHRRRWSGVRAYEQSKQANRMLAWAWDRRLAGTGVSINVAHPGGVATGIAGRQTGWYGALARLAFRTQRTPTHGAETPLWLAAVPQPSGGFYKDRSPIPCQWRASISEGERLWHLTQAQLERS